MSMFSWANAQLANLAETLAPPPTTPPYQYLTALKSQNEQMAMEIISSGQLGDPSSHLALPSNSTGLQLIHYAAQYGCLQVVQYLVQQCGVNCKSCFDYQGNTVLHWATRGDNLNLVQYLITEVQCDATLKNAAGQTAYDFCEDCDTNNNVARIRQYLLPIQLQAETKECLANGGQGLAAGIDLGGAAVQAQMYANLAPPPAAPAAAMTSPPPMGNVGGNAGYGMNSMASRYVAYTPGSTNIYGGPMAMQPPQQQQVPQYSYPAAAAPSPQQPQMQQPMAPVPPVAPTTAAAPPNMMSAGNQNGSVDPVTSTGPMPGPAPAAPTSSQEAPISTGSSGNSNTNNNKAQQPLFTPLPPPPFYNKPAVVVAKAAAAPRERLRPDGFHSSSSDVALQKKYGHIKQDLGDVPPPPISNGSSSGGGNGYSMSAYAAPPPPAPAVVNPPPPVQNFAPPPPNMNYAAFNPASQVQHQQQQEEEDEVVETADFTSTSSSVM